MLELLRHIFCENRGQRTPALNRSDLPRELSFVET